MKKYIITILTLFFLIILSITGYFVYGSIKENKANSIDTLKEKCKTEIEYVGDNIILIMNELNNISNTNTQIVSEEIEESDAGNSNQDTSSGNSEEENSNVQNQSSQNQKNTITLNNMSSASILERDDIDKVNWDSIEIKVQDLYSAWTSIMIDLSALNVNKDNLLVFNNNLDRISKSIEDKNKIEALINSAELYNLLAKYANEFYTDKNEVSLLNVESSILYSYAEIERDNWGEAGNYITKAKNEFSNVLNNQINNINKIDIINKAYVLINELEEDCNNNERKIFLINYSNLIQELQNI